VLHQVLKDTLGDNANQWNSLKQLVDDVELSQEPGSVQWTIGSSGKLKVYELYFHLR
jgi:hypothetical protein